MARQKRGNPDEPTRVAIAERRAKVRDGFIARKSVQQIADEMGVNRRTIYDDYTWIMRQYRHDLLGPTEDLVLQDLSALNDDERQLRERWGVLTELEHTETWLRVYDRILKVIERRAKLLGLDATEEIRLDAVQVNQLVTQLVHVVVAVVSNDEERRAIVTQVDDMLRSFGAGPYSLPQESTENANSPDPS